MHGASLARVLEQAVTSGGMSKGLRALDFCPGAFPSTGDKTAFVQVVILLRYWQAEKKRQEAS